MRLLRVSSPFQMVYFWYFDGDCVMFIRSTYSSRLNFCHDKPSKVTNELSQVNETAATGKQINRLSDAPFKGSLLHNLRHYFRTKRIPACSQFFCQSAVFNRECALDAEKPSGQRQGSLQSSFQMTHTMLLNFNLG